MKKNIEWKMMEEFEIYWTRPEVCGNLRRGQAFHNFFKLEKCLQDKEKYDRLWNMDKDADKLIFALFEFN